MDGILNIHKPVGMTSFDVVARVRRLTGTKKVGHAGTLDPDASGVLPVCAGKATKVIEFLMEKDKAYRVGLYLGKATDTQDASGTMLYEKKVMASDEEIVNVIKGFTGQIEQIPPMYSALRVDGKRLYDLARQGITIERKPRKVMLYRIEILAVERAIDAVQVMMDVECSKGTYMRTLCHDIGEMLGCGGHMASLERTRSGPFLLGEAYTLEALAELKESQRLETALIPMDRAIQHFPAVTVSQQDARRLKNGLSVEIVEGLTPGFCRVYHEDGSFLAVGHAARQENSWIMKSTKWIGSDTVCL